LALAGGAADGAAAVNDPGALGTAPPPPADSLSSFKYSALAASPPTRRSAAIADSALPVAA